MSFRLSLIVAQFVHWSISLLYSCWLRLLYSSCMCAVYTCLSGCMCWGVRMCPCMYLETRVQHPCSLLLSTFFSLLLCFTFENFIDVYNEYIYCFPFHSVLIVTKCPLCNFMGLSLLSFCFANPLRPVGAVHMFIGVEPFPGGWESTNGQTRTILSPQQLIPVHSSLWKGEGSWKASHPFSLECWSSWVCVGFLCQ